MDDIPIPIPARPTRLLDQLREHMRSRNLSYKTEQTYIGWIVNYIYFHNKTHPKNLGSNDIDAYLSHLAVRRNLSINTQKTALNAVVYLYKQFYGIQNLELKFTHSKKPRLLPAVFSHAEASNVISHLNGIYKIAASLMYGSGLRVMEAVRLRIKDIDFANGCIMVTEAKGAKSRRTLLPKSLIQPLKSQIEFALALHAKDIADGYGEVYPHHENHNGNIYSPRIIDPWILDRLFCVGIILEKVQYNVLSSRRSGKPRSTKRPVAIPSATASPPTYYEPALIFATFKR